MTADEALDVLFGLRGELEVRVSGKGGPVGFLLCHPPPVHVFADFLLQALVFIAAQQLRTLADQVRKRERLKKHLLKIWRAQVLKQVLRRQTIPSRGS